MKVDGKYAIQVVDAMEFVGTRRGKWAELCGQIMKQIKAMPQGKSLKVELDDVEEAKSFRASMRNLFHVRKLSKTYVVGMSKGEPVVFVGRR